MEIDALGAFNVSRAVQKLWMGEHGGSIVNITATLYYRGDVMQAHAGAAKAAIGALTIAFCRPSRLCSHLFPRPCCNRRVDQAHGSGMGCHGHPCQQRCAWPHCRH